MAIGPQVAKLQPATIGTIALRTKVAYLGLADNSCGPLLSPVEPSEGSLSTGCQVSKRVVNPLCSPPFLLVDIPIPRRWMSFFLVHPLPYLGLRPRRHPVEQHFFE